MGEQRPEAQTTRLAQQPRMARPRQIRRSKDQRAITLSAPPPEGAAQRRQGRSRQLRTVKQSREVSQALDITIIIKFQLARRMQFRQLGSLRAPILASPERIEGAVLRPKFDVARVSQAAQKAATKSARLL